MENSFEDLAYDEQTGKLFWRRRVNARAGPAAEAGYLKPDGYRVIKIAGKGYYAHRLVWHLTHGVWPKEIDHINGNRDDNRIENLREATGKNNQNRNKACNNTSGITGVMFNRKRSKWYSACYSGGKLNFLGYFSSPEAARDAYVAFKRDNHPFYEGRD